MEEKTKQHLMCLIDQNWKYLYLYKQTASENINNFDVINELCTALQ